MMYKKFRQFCHDNVHIYTLYSFLCSLKNLIFYGHMSTRKFIVAADKKLVYLRNSKVACSSIETSMYDGVIKDDYSIHRMVNDSGMRKSKLSAEEEKYFKFTYVRNPYERLVSCYESKYHVDRDKYQKKMVRFDYYLCGYLRKDRGFDNFIKRIARLPDSWMDEHFRLQYDLTHDRHGNKLVDHIGHYENLEEDFKEIRMKYGLKELPHYNNSGGKKRDWRSYYTIETAEIVYKKYEKDFRYLGYEDSYKDLIAYIRDRDKKAV